MASMDPSLERALRLREHVVFPSELETEIVEQKDIIERAVTRLQSGDLSEAELTELCETIDHGVRVNERLRLRVQKDLDRL